MLQQLDKPHWIGWDASTAVLAQSRKAAAPLGFQGYREPVGIFSRALQF